MLCFLFVETSWRAVFSPGIRTGLDGKTEKPVNQVNDILFEAIYALVVLLSNNIK